jgi:nitrate reductase alpha subunit
MNDSHRQLLAHARTPAEAVITAASLVGVGLFESQAQAIADAALSFADSAVELTGVYDREMWQIDSFREYTRRELHMRLLDTIFANNMVPIALPAETITYRKDSPGSPRAGTDVPESADWNSVYIVLSVPVRTPAADHEHTATDDRKAGAL